MYEPPDYIANETVQEYIERMQKAGYKILVPEPNQLFIDIDTKEQLKQYLSEIERFRDEYTVKEIKQTPSRRKADGFHITVTLDREITNIERIVLQAILGSDPRRELLGLFRIWNEEELVTIFCEKGD